MINNNDRNAHHPLAISEIAFFRSSDEERAVSHLGYSSCAVSGTLRLDGLVLRRTLRRQLRITFPTRLDRSGRRHYVIAPIDDRSREVVEEQVLRQIRDRLPVGEMLR